jgi:PBP1b-binding outer membrane lipoprotein LpoB
MLIALKMKKYAVMLIVAAVLLSSCSYHTCPTYTKKTTPVRTQDQAS